MKAVFLLVASLAVSSASGATLTRSEATAALLSSTGGITLGGDTSVWCVPLDLGAGTGSEGLFPTGTAFSPRWNPQAGTVPEVVLDRPAYFFWIDDDPVAEFAHPTRFVWVTADDPAPTVANGGIRVEDREWWPLIRMPGGRVLEPWATSQVRVTSAPPGPSNPDGLIAGFAPTPIPAVAPGGLVRGTARPAGPPEPDPDACGLIIRGAPDVHMGTNVHVFRSDLINHFGVAPERIVTANGGEAATCAQLVAAIQAVCEMEPPCKKVYVRITSHGSQGCLILADGCLPALQFCRKFGPIAAKGARVHMLINACYSHGLVDTNVVWGFAEGSTIVTSAHSNKTSYGGAHFESGGSTKIVSLFADAFSECLKAPAADANADGHVDDIEAFDWVWAQRPCYFWKPTGRMRYPAGKRAGSKEDPLVVNPYPQKTIATRPPISLALVVRNGTGEAKTDFHMIYAGNVTGGTATAKRALPSGSTIGGELWGKPRISHDAARDETMVCWDAPNDPIQSGQHVLFSYGTKTNGLRLIRSYWTPTTDPPAPGDQVPTKTGSIRIEGDRRRPAWREASIPTDFGGWSLPFSGAHGFALMQRVLNPDELQFGTPDLLAAATHFLGPVVIPPGAALETPLQVAAPGAPVPPVIVLISQGQAFQNAHFVFSFEQYLLDPARDDPPAIAFQADPGAIVLNWSGAGVLQETDALGPDAVWRPVEGATERPVRLPILNQPGRFFRVHP